MKTKQQREFPTTCTWHYSPIAWELTNKLDPATVSGDAHLRGMENGEPLLIAMDALYKYAWAYRERFENGLANDGVLGEAWLDAAKGIRALLNSDGAIALFKNITTDSKDNGVIEDLFWKAMEVAGFTEKDL